MTSIMYRHSYTAALAVVALSYLAMWWVFGIPGWDSAPLSDPGLPIPETRALLLGYCIATLVVVALRLFNAPLARPGTALVSIVAATWIPLGTAAFVYWFLRARKLEG